MPSHSWLRWRYHYPQAAFPYEDLIAENARRGFDEPEYELLDTGVFDDGRFFSVEVDYAKRDPDDVCMRITARNHGDRPAPLHLLPQLWFRNVWSWGNPDEAHAVAPRLQVSDDGGSLELDHPRLGRWHATASDPSGAAVGRWLCCENETNVERIYGADAAASTPDVSAYPKDGIGDHVRDRGADRRPRRCRHQGSLLVHLRGGRRRRGRGAAPPAPVRAGPASDPASSG